MQVHSRKKIFSRSCAKIGSLRYAAAGSVGRSSSLRKWRALMGTSVPLGLILDECIIAPKGVSNAGRSDVIRRARCLAADPLADFRPVVHARADRLRAAQQCLDRRRADDAGPAPHTAADRLD